MLKDTFIVLTWLFLCTILASPSSSPILFRVSALPDGRGVIVRPYIAPYLNLKPKENAEIAELRPGDILSCSQSQKSRTFGDHRDEFVVFECAVGDSRSKGKHFTLTMDGLRFVDDPYEQEKK